MTSHPTDPTPPFLVWSIIGTNFSLPYHPNNDQTFKRDIFGLPLLLNLQTII